MNAELVKPTSPGSNSKWPIRILQLVIALAILAGFAALDWYRNLPERLDDQQTLVLGRTRFAPGSDASVRVVVQDFAAGEPIAGAQVKVSFQAGNGRPQVLYQGQTDETGSAPVSFQVPEDAPAEAQLIVETRSDSGQDRVEQPVRIERVYRLLLTSDKPLYQPGQTMHLRALALSTFDLTPARGATVDFLVEDARGNKVYRQSVTASDYGIAAADFTLADMVNQGNYKLSVTIGDTQSEKTVEVRPYVLPKFGLQISTDRSFYLPSERVTGQLQADYFFGKPVANSEVQLVGSVWDVARTVVVDLHGRTNENGTFEFEFALPDYLAGSGLDAGQAQFALEATVIDQTDHAEQTSQVLPIAQQPLLIEAVPESGQLKPGVENIIYLLTTYPDGRPAQTQLSITYNNHQIVETSTSEHGLTTFTLTPTDYHQTVLISAQDQTGRSANRRFNFETEYGSDSVLLRTDRAAYLLGETMNLLAFSSVHSGSIYLDIVKAGQTLSTRSATIENGRAEFTVDLSTDLYGTLELHAYKVLLDSTIVRDTRLVVVDAPNEIAIDISADQDTYLPGELATIDFQTTDAAQGTELETALGLAIVDESVFALQRQDPGFAKLYFMLEQELLEPFYQIKDFQLPAAIYPEDDAEQVRLAQDDAAKATLAEGPVTAAVQPINSRPEKEEIACLRQQSGFKRVASAALWGMILTPLAVWAVVILVVRRSGAAGPAFRRLGIASAIILLVGGLVGILITAFANSLYFYDLEVILLPLLVFIGLGMLVFVIYAWSEDDQGAQLLTSLTLCWVALLFLLGKASDMGGISNRNLASPILWTFVLIPGAYLLFGQNRWLSQKRLPGMLATGLGLASIIPVVILLPFTLFSAGSFAAPATQRLGLDNGGDWVKDEPVFETVAVEKVVMVTQIIEEAGEETIVLESSQEQVETPRLRQYFPETLYWAPEVQTDSEGFVSLEIPMADSITTWRLTALASSQDGRLGFTTRGVRVFQDFFVDIDLPVALTQGDEISIPVGVFNYLPAPQEVRLQVQAEPWFELLGQAEQTLTIASNDIDVVYFPIRVLDFGREGFQVTAWGQQMSDAIRREVTVVPDGQQIRHTESDWLKESKEIEIEIPGSAVQNTPYAEVKIYPGAMSQVVEGLEKILKLPHG